MHTNKCLMLVIVLVFAAVFAAAAPQEAASRLFARAFKKRFVADAHLPAAVLLVDVPSHAPVVSRDPTTQMTQQSSQTIDVTNTTTNNNNDDNNNNNKLPPLPVTVTSGDSTLITQGHCVTSCKPSAAKLIASFSWTTSLPTPIRYSLTATPNNPNIVQSVDVRTKDTATVDNSKVAAYRGLIASRVGVRAGANATLAERYRDIEIEIFCRARGQTAVHVTVSDVRSVYAPTHFFVLALCPEPVSEGCNGVDCGAYGVCYNASCHCITGYSGSQCNNSQFDNCPRKCSGHGVGCEGGVCVCALGYTGVDCGRAEGCRDLAFCSGNGECVDGSFCACNQGWTGEMCNLEAAADSTCKSYSHCSGHGTCKLQSFGLYECECEAGYVGVTCGVALSLCPAACSGHGKCVSGECVCDVGFGGHDCSHVISLCDSCSACLGRGKCEDPSSVEHHHCRCTTGWTGDKCDQYDIEADMAEILGFCGGRGVYNEQTYSCDCFNGFGGPECDQVVAKGCQGHCHGKGRCNVKTDMCECYSGWGGEGCTVPLCPVSDGVVCSGNGACMKSKVSATVECVCGAGFFGPSCNMAQCHANSTCHTHGKCVKKTGVWNKLCKCDDGWSGARCEAPIQPGTSNTNTNPATPSADVTVIATNTIESSAPIAYTTTTTTNADGSIVTVGIPTLLNAPPPQTGAPDDSITTTSIWQQQHATQNNGDSSSKYRMILKVPRRKDLDLADFPDLA